ncbi:hypothetical protein [Paenibacillus sp. 481]|uniref:hypothetical protein n=1 Tax=Paenibacillus sp. 481 TaxID=2835869 RepID=UPI001E2E091D|nr:hypothetical protein [Paenibacillus sp. 481]UHA72130.1 hypothetical protein KIK04_15650 [Paenibacillus sp. 481]
MKRYSVIEIVNLEPLKIGAVGSKANQTEPSKDYVPGSTIRGAMISQLIHNNSFDEHQKEILTKLECYNAYPYHGEHIYLPTPQHLRMNKHQWRKAKVLARSSDEEQMQTIKISNLLDTCKEQDGEQDKNTLEFRFLSVQDKNIRGMNAVKEYRLHHNMSRKQDEKERDNLFRYQALAAGHTFRAIVSYDQSIEHVIVPVLKQSTKWYLGGAKGSGYGLCQLRLIAHVQTDFHAAKKALGLHTAAMPTADKLTITCLSDCICRDTYGQPVNAIPTDEIESLIGVPVKLKRQYVQTGITEGYNATWKARYPKETTLKAGSVLEYELQKELTQQEKIQMIQALESKLIGYRTQDGFGWIGAEMSNPAQQLLVVKAVQPLSEQQKHNAAAMHQEQQRTAEVDRVLDIIISGLKPAKERWLEMIYVKSRSQSSEGEPDSNRILISDQLNRHQLEQMRKLLEQRQKQLEEGELPTMPDSIERYYKKDNRLCSVAGCNFTEILEFICTTNRQSNGLMQFAKQRLDSTKGELFYSKASLKEKLFIAELLHAGLYIEQRRAGKSE